MEIQESWKLESGLYKCPHCYKEYKKLGIGTHIWKNHTEKGRLYKRTFSKREFTPWNKGLTKETNIRIKESAEKLKERYKNGELVGSFLNKHHTEKVREEIQIAINKRYENGWLPKAGRCKKIKYLSSIAGEVSVDGTWELRVAKYLDKNNINWKRNTQRFDYFDEDKKRYYTPDFYLVDTDEYLEVKGYETKLDRCKWRQFPHKLIVWKEDDLKKKNII